MSLDIILTWIVFMDLKIFTLELKMNWYTCLRQCLSLIEFLILSLHLTISSLTMDVSHSVCYNVDDVIFSKTEYILCWKTSFCQVQT